MATSDSVGFDLWPGNLEDRRRRLLLEPMGRLVVPRDVQRKLAGVISLIWKSTEEVDGSAAQAAGAAVASFTDVVWRDLEATRAALRAGIPVDQRDHYGNTLLMEAAHQHDAQLGADAARGGRGRARGEPALGHRPRPGHPGPLPRPRRR